MVAILAFVMYASLNWWVVTTTTMKFKPPVAPFAFVKYHCGADSNFPVECHEFFNGLEPTISAQSRDECLWLHCMRLQPFSKKV